MAFFVCEPRGVAFESTEGGYARWSADSRDFSELMSDEEYASVAREPWKRVSEDEARVFMESKSDVGVGA